MKPIDRCAAAVSCTLLACCAALLLSACASSTPTRYFALEAVAPSSAARGDAPAPMAYDGPPIEVRSVQIPPTLDRLEMVREVAPGELDVRDFDHWAAPLGRMSRQALTEDLASRLPPDRLVFPGAAGPKVRGDLTVDVLSFRIDGGTATMVMSWSLRWPEQTTPRGASLQLTAPATAGAAATSRAWSELMAQAADRIAADLHAR
jgi:uncharacterized lipoprotein YmbA